MAFIPQPEHRSKTEAFQQAAIDLREHANAVDKIALLLDDSALNCTDCGSTHYLNWPQRQLRARVTGAGDRLREIADTFQRRAADPDFLNGTPLPPRNDNWTTPRHPGDTVRIAMFRKGDDLGDVRIQWYGDYSVRVGSFLPGVEECSPGDTPKTYPEKFKNFSTRNAADNFFDLYVEQALLDGWKPYDPKAPR